MTCNLFGAMGANRCIRAFLRDQQGAIMAFMAFGLFVSAGLGALAMDMGYLYIVKSRLQVAADVAALAAVRQLPDEAAAQSTALTYAVKNMPASAHGGVLVNADVVLGNWDSNSNTFTPAGVPVDAVRIVTRRSGDNGNAVGLFFGRIIGFDEMDVTRTSIAVKKSNSCYTNGIVAGNQVLSSSNNNVLDSFCVYGRNGVAVGSNNSFSAGTQIGMLNLNDLQAGSNNTGLSDALAEMDLTPDLTTDIAALINDIQTNLPDYITQTQNVSALPDPLVPGTAYFVDQPVDIPSGTTLNDVVIVSTDKITVGSDVSLANVILAAGDNVELGSYGAIGDSDYCIGGGDGGVQLIATINIVVGSNTDFFGAQLIAGVDADLGSNEISSTALALQAGNDITLGSNVNLSVCNGPTDHARFTEDDGSKLVK